MQRQTKYNRTVKARNSKRRWWSLLAALLAFSGLFLGFVWQSLGWQPAFYRAALTTDRATAAKAGDAFEQVALDWFNQTKQIGRWSVEFNAAQVNGWLSTDFGEKFPGTLPQTVESPRIDFRDREIELAFKWRWSLLSGVATVRADLFAAGQEGEIGLRLKGAYAGLVPLPLRVIGDRISEVLRRAQCTVRWGELQGDPVLLIGPPAKYRQVERATLTIKTINVKQGTLAIINVGSNLN